MNKNSNTLKGKKTRYFKEHIPVTAWFYMASELHDPSYCEIFGKKCVRDFVD